MKDPFLKLGEDREGFDVSVVKIGKSPEWLTGDILWNLWDIGVKFGGPVPKGLAFRQSPITMELYNFSHTGGGAKDGFAVFKIEEDQPIAHMGMSVMLELINGMVVVFDGLLTFEEVTDIIQAIDEEATKRGKIKDGKRITIPVIDPSLN